MTTDSGILMSQDMSFYLDIKQNCIDKFMREMSKRNEINAASSILHQYEKTWYHGYKFFSYFSTLRIAHSCIRFGRIPKRRKSGLRLIPYANAGFFFSRIFIVFSAIFPGGTHFASTLSTMRLNRSALHR